jgi:8-oxo-dGTP pyrophosphatase MutT (NUDIX family)
MDGIGTAAGVMYVAGGKILLMKRRPDAIHGDTWAFPAGTIENGEGPADTADREFLEETGKDITVPLFEIFSDGNFTLFRVDGDEFIPTMCPEHTAYAWFAPNELPASLHPGVAEQIKMAYSGTPR